MLRLLSLNTSIYILYRTSAGHTVLSSQSLQPHTNDALDTSAIDAGLSSSTAEGARLMYFTVTALTDAVNADGRIYSCWMFINQPTYHKSSYIKSSAVHSCNFSYYYCYFYSISSSNHWLMSIRISPQPLLLRQLLLSMQLMFRLKLSVPQEIIASVSPELCSSSTF